jgi:uncharacterized membrane protein
MSHIMPYILSVIGMTALILIGRRRWYGWAIAFGNECLWVGFAIATRQYGFIVGAIFYGTINLHNAMLWRNGKPWISGHTG